jgi:hypothetical protein
MNNERAFRGGGASPALRDRFLTALDADDHSALRSLSCDLQKLHGHPAKHRVRGVWSTTRQYLRESRKDNRRVMTGDRATRFGNLASGISWQRGTDSH